MVGVAVGTAWAGGGFTALAAGALVVLKAVPVLVVAAGVLILLRVVAPPGALAGPLVLIASGSVALAIQFGMLATTMLDVVGPTLLLAGGVMIAMSRPSRKPTLATIVARHYSVFWSTKLPVQGTAPHKFVLNCVLGGIELDLTNASYPGDAYRITVDITLLGGQVKLYIPAGWNVRAGRMHLARGTTFYGNLSSSKPVPDEPEVDEDSLNLVVLNVQGRSGCVTVNVGQERSLC
ncbi:MAG: hypothetical protein ACRDQ9_00075 [Pseudonocardiaceae bacterium]